MSLVHDSAIVHSKCHGKSKKESEHVTIRELSSKNASLLRSISVPSLSSIVKNSLYWAGDTFHSYRDGLSKEERKSQMRIEDNKQILYLRMRNAVSYDEWRNCACELDSLEDNNTWKQTFESSDYDPHLVQESLRQLEDARINCDMRRMLFLIRTSLSRDLGNMSNVALYRHSHFGTKDLIDRYITTALDTISTLVDLSGKVRCDGLELKYILDQLLAARQAFGRSALLFSGGATFGMNHIGVLKALWQSKLLPRIISGASAGSIVCAVFCTRTEDEIPALLDAFPQGNFAVFNEEGHEENILQKTARLLKYGSFLDISHLAKVIRSWLGDITFQEAYNRTRRILNICVSSAGIYELPRLLNYITAPNVLIWSAVAVSCSVPLVFSPFVIMAKDPLTGQPVPWSDLHRQYIDGSVDGDLPMTRLSEMFNVNHFIVSQVNPHVVPFLPKDDGPSDGTESSQAPGWLHTVTHLAKEEVLHRMTVLSELGVFPTSLTKVVSIVNQKYSGDINIYPEILYTNFPLMLKNPTTDFMLKACLSGERATWPRLGRIRNHCAIELALDSAIQKMRARVAFSPSQIELRLNNLNYNSIDSFDSTGGRGRMINRRRNSFSHECEKRRHIRRNSGRFSIAQIRKSRSVLSFEQPQTSESSDTPGPEMTKPRFESHPSYIPNTGDGPFNAEIDSTEEREYSFPRRPAPPRHRASWGPSSYDHPSAWPGQHSPVRSRQSSSAYSQRSSSIGTILWQPNHEFSSPRGYPVPDKAMSPPQNVLSMTPTVNSSFSNLTSSQT
ncbi:hypothetical protein ASPWEDRAFT_100495 [Aspergillus wentii DTO 134E9]|uniref:Patatin-like phospholipase domain-containing protein n=1 Tax=Aspergillus wentii DTO 134E9 TaxID=1073089 RepID=A0A1L9S1F9_ASPWE|nr:uncharacterized protein ASPWEDRAFT_100495 [Aspergillus wentii DTO 134E9]KAI9931012.1 hypothetical protein MW887_010667 [Aspergillus wentii]OJJ40994.1 hypothetical protein ASPWEDRAFT_100495 [Aspergillus wentii DTO 134E9]